MTVKQLLEVLKHFDADATVVLQADAEGNGYSPCAGAEEGFYISDSAWSGAFYSKANHDEAEKAVVIWPLN